MSAYLDERRGHFRLDLPARRGGDLTGHGPFVLGCDMGAYLNVWANAADLTADDARELAAALTWWADRQHADDVTPERVAEACDLLALLDEETA